MNNRRTIYFSKKYDKDLIDLISSMEEEVKFNEIVKGLMRDGIMYRRKENVLQSNTIQYKPNLNSIKSASKELDRTELEDRLDMF